MTEDAIIKGLNWLKNNQDSDGGWGDKDKTPEGNKPRYGTSSHKQAMTSMAPPSFSLDIANCRIHLNMDLPFRKRSISSPVHLLMK